MKVTESKTVMYKNIFTKAMFISSGEIFTPGRVSEYFQFYSKSESESS